MAALLDHLGIVFTPYAWLGHVLMGLGLQAALAVPLLFCRVRGAWWLAACVSAGFWWGREKVEHEFALKAAAGLRTLGPFWWRGWFPWDWGTASAWEFLAPALTGFGLALVLTRRPAGR